MSTKVTGVTGVSNACQVDNTMNEEEVKMNGWNIVVKVNEEDLNTLTKASEKEMRPRSQFIRWAALKKANEVLNNETD